MRLWVLIVSLWMSSGYGAVSRPHYYRYVYYGGLIAKDVGRDGFPAMEPNRPVLIESAPRPFQVLNQMYQLPIDGSLPAALIAPGYVLPFSAIVRYDPKVPGSISRALRWINANKRNCREIHVVNYPIQGETTRDRILLERIASSFIDHRYTIIPHYVGVNDEGESPDLFDLLHRFSTLVQPHGV